MSPTSDAVIYKTLEMAIDVADKCSQQFISDRMSSYCFQGIPDSS